MAQQFIQQLTVHLKGGQTVVVPFNAEKAEVLNPQIEAFIKALGDTTKKDGNFLFQGARVVLFRLSEVSGADGSVAHLAHLGGFAAGYFYLKILFKSRLPWDPFRRRLRPGEWREPPPFRSAAQPPPNGNGQAADAPVSSRELDALLDKVSRDGINSLSEYELARLRKAREQMRGGSGR